MILNPSKYDDMLLEGYSQIDYIIALKLKLVETKHY